MNSPSVMVDIDGTLCDARGRDHLLDKVGDPDWQAHSMACADDPPIPATVALVQRLAANHNIVLCSGRSVIARDLTIDWMKRYGVPWNYLALRPVGNRDNNAKYKVAWAKALTAEGYDFVLAIDDYVKTANALNDYGIPCLLVASFTRHAHPDSLPTMVRP